MQSVSATFNKQLCHWFHLEKNYKNCKYRKAACKMLVKLTLGRNFINVGWKTRDNFSRYYFSVTFLLPSPDQKCDKAGDEHFNSKTIKSSSASSHRTSSFTTTTTTRYEHRTLIKNVVGQFSPSGGRYSILNRDFSLKGSTENVARYRFNITVNFPIR